MAIFSPVRASTAALRRPSDSFSDDGFFGLGAQRLAVPNTNIVPMPDSSFNDERIYRQMRSTPEILSSIEARKRNLLGLGWDLEPGDRDAEGSAELYGFWSEVLAGLPVQQLLELVLDVRFDGWAPFEVNGEDSRFDVRPATRAGQGAATFVPSRVYDWKAERYAFAADETLLFRAGLRGDVPVRPPRSLTGLMNWFTPSSGSLSNPYGDALLGFLRIHLWLHQRFLDIGVGQVSQATGLATMKKTGPPAEAAAAEEGKQRVQQGMQEISDAMEEMLDTLRADGVLIEPPGWMVTWNDNKSAVDGWVKIWKHGGDLTREILAGGVEQLSGSMGGSNRALSQTHREGGLDAARVDGEMVNDQIRRKFFWPWSAWNAEAILGRQVRPTGSQRRLRDVSPAALPRLRFKRCCQVNTELLQLVLSHGSSDTRVDLDPLARDGHIPLMAPDQDGPALEPGQSVAMLPAVEDGEDDGNVDGDEDQDGED